ncbi:MAG: hypothetical protein RDU24_13690 [Humidesulfovibrio sp.]|uniref:hypothetical protein n=1 Tax=Humidesulfovibrio sp. TaxID=2910988 RepID=UPI0027E5CF91|nr:hypothetical protein [Humidesulfovibrio sp.]MDQ7836428.1 hypothetical protein [Humidesulfovibrio sp.]
MFHVIEIQDENGNIIGFGLGNDGKLVRKLGHLTTKEGAEMLADAENKRAAAERESDES